MTQHGNISYQPTDGLSYDPSDPVYWDAGALQREIARVFEVCHGCRMCFKFCDSFPKLFEYIDQRHDGDVRKLTPNEVDSVMGACFQCKLCEVQCPYTPRDGHAFQLDFPRLVHRHRAQQAKRDGLSWRDRILGHPDLAGRIARATFGLANVLNRAQLHRWFLEKVLGIDRRKELPPFATSTFEDWAADTGRCGGKPSGEAVLFQTCYVQNNDPELGRDVIAALEANRVDVRCVRGLGCCGMPAWEHGDLSGLREMARRNLEVLMPWVDAGARVLVINPTCSMMMRREYPDLLEGEDRERARRLAGATHGVSEYLWSIRKEDRFNTTFRSTPGPVAYHAPCHLRAQAVGFPGRDLIRKIPETSPRFVAECCGHDGTFAMTVEGFEPSIRLGNRAFEDMRDAEAEVWATDCPLAALQFAQHAGRRPLHPLSILARAYREDGFARRLEPAEEQENAG